MKRWILGLVFVALTARPGSLLVAQDAPLAAWPGTRWVDVPPRR